MAIDWYYLNDYLALGVDWNYTSNEYNVKSSPIVYRWDNTNTNNYGGSFSETLSPDPSGSGSWSGLSFGSGSGQRQIDSFSERTYTRSGGDYTVTLTISWESIGYYHNGFHSLGNGSHSWTLTISQPTMYAPRAPKNFKAVYNNDKSMTLSWGSNYTGTDDHWPWSGIYIDRATDGGSWSRIATLGWGATSYTDSSTSAGHRYQYRARPYNSAGSTASSASSYLYTTPNAMSALEVSKPTITVVGLTPSGLPSYYDAIEFQSSNDSGANWQDISVTESGSTPPYIDEEPLKGTVIYRARCTKQQVNASGTTLTLASDWCESNSVLTLQAPNAPAIQALQSVYATGTTIELQWSPNHPDGTAQTKAQVEVTAPDGTATTLDISGDTTMQAIDLDTVGTYKIRVRTYGLYEDWGAWSSYTTVQVADVPVIAITAPTAGEAVEALPYSIAWTITDVSGVSYQQLTITDASGKSYVNAALDTSARSYELTGDIGLNNGVEYAIELYVRNGASLTNTTTSTFSTLWDAPSDPVIEIENDDNLAAHITFVASEEVSGIPPTVNYSLSRVMPDGQTNTLLTGATAGQEFIDRIAPLNTEYTYVVVAYAESGATSSQEYTNTIITNKIAINFDSDASVALFGVYNPDWSRTPSHSVSLFHFMDGSSDGLPMAYTMNELEEEHSYSFVVNLDDYRLFDAASRAYVMGWLRDAYGSVVRAQISISTSRFSPDYWTVNVKGNKVRWEEPSNG